MHTSIKLPQLKQWLAEQANLRILDVRSAEEYLEKHIPQAIHMPLASIESGMFTPETGQIIICACGKGGGRSEKSAEWIRLHFPNEVYFLEGGTFGWYEEQEKG